MIKKCYNSVPLCTVDQLLIKISNLPIYCCIDKYCETGDFHIDIDDLDKHQEYPPRAPPIQNYIQNSQPALHSQENSLEGLICDFDVPFCPDNTVIVKLPYKDEKSIWCCISETQDDNEVVEEGIHSDFLSYEVSGSAKPSSPIYLEKFETTEFEKCYSTVDGCDNSPFYVFNFFKVKIFCCVDTADTTRIHKKNSADNMIDEVPEDCSRETKKCSANHMLVKVYFILDFWCCMPTNSWQKRLI